MHGTIFVWIVFMFWVDLLLACKPAYGVEAAHPPKSDQRCWEVLTSKDWAYPESGDVTSSETVRTGSPVINLSFFLLWLLALWWRLLCFIRYYKWILERNFRDLNKGVRGNQVSHFNPFNLWVFLQGSVWFYVSLCFCLSFSRWFWGDD